MENVLRTLKQNKVKLIEAQEVKDYFDQIAQKLLKGKTVQYLGHAVDAYELFKTQTGAKSHHDVGVGGLYDHCFRFFVALVEHKLAKNTELTVEQCARIAILHDTCKLPLYYTTADGGYDYFKDIYPHHAKLSIEMITEWGIELSVAESVCIKLHMAGWQNQEDMDMVTEEEKQWLFDLKHIQILQAVNLADNK